MALIPMFWGRAAMVGCGGVNLFEQTQVENEKKRRGEEEERRTGNLRMPMGAQREVEIRRIEANGD